jgi:hypothetical protein
MKKKKAERPRSARCLADDSRLQNEDVFQTIFSKWSERNTEEYATLVLDLVNKGYSVRCIARNLPGSPDESVVRGLKDRAKLAARTKQELGTPEDTQSISESKGTQPDEAGKEPVTQATAPFNAPEEPIKQAYNFPGKPYPVRSSANLADEIKKRMDQLQAERTNIEGEVTKNRRTGLPSQWIPELQEKVSKELKERKEAEEAYRAKLALLRRRSS